MKRPPNILFLMSDEHRADVCGFAGNTVIRTPNLDELAHTGVVFRNAYTPSPICIPGRQAMMSGRFPRSCGCEHFGQDLEPGAMTFARRFSQHAYATVCSGKLHHVGRDQMQGWLKRLAGDVVMDERLIEDRDPAAFAKIREQQPRWKWSDMMEIHRARPDTESRNQRFDLHATRAAVEFIEEYFIDHTYDRLSPDRPLFLKVSLVQPHYPYICTRDLLGYYFNRVQPFVNEEVFDHPFLSERQVRVGDDGATEREIRRATAAYYGMIETVDKHFGEVLQALRSAGQNLDDWIIIFTSDHGEMLGEHGIWEKQKFFEGSVRVPLVVRWPRRFEARVVKENVNLCDIFATLCELADIPIPQGLDSRSLVPLLKGDSSGWDDETVSQFGGGKLMIKRGPLKYQYYGEAMPEVLFDLSVDPGERSNCIAEPRHAAALAGFRRRRRDLGFGSA